MKARIFLVTACLILTMTALTKMISAYQPTPYLDLRDPLFEFMTNRQLLFGTAAVELVGVILLIWVKNLQHRLALIAWLGSMFLLYRVSIILVKTPGFAPCPCLGNTAAWLHIDPVHLDWLMKSVLAYLLLGSYGMLIGLQLRQKQKIVTGTTSCYGLEV